MSARDLSAFAVLSMAAMLAAMIATTCANALQGGF
jgi:hypothetical protein